MVQILNAKIRQIQFKRINLFQSYILTSKYLQNLQNHFKYLLQITNVGMYKNNVAYYIKKIKNLVRFRSL